MSSSNTNTNTNTNTNGNFVSKKVSDIKKNIDFNKNRYQKSNSKINLDKLRKSQNFLDLGDAFDYFSD